MDHRHDPVIPASDAGFSTPDPGAVRTGSAFVGDTRQGDLCRATVRIAAGTVLDAELDVISDEPPDASVAVFLTYLRGRSVEEVLRAVTARSCSSDGCSSVEGKCFSLLQEAVYRALGQAAKGKPRVLSTPQGGVDLSRRRIPAVRPDDENLAEAAEWARTRLLPADNG